MIDHQLDRPALDEPAIPEGLCRSLREAFTCAPDPATARAHLVRLRAAADDLRTIAPLR